MKTNLNRTHRISFAVFFFTVLLVSCSAGGGSGSSQAGSATPVPDAAASGILPVAAATATVSAICKTAVEKGSTPDVRAADKQRALTSTTRIAKKPQAGQGLFSEVEENPECIAN